MLIRDCILRKKFSSHKEHVLCDGMKLYKPSQKIYGRPPTKRKKKKYDPLTPDPATIPDEYKVPTKAEKAKILASVD